MRIKKCQVRFIGTAIRIFAKKDGVVLFNDQSITHDFALFRGDLSDIFEIMGRKAWRRLLGFQSLYLWVFRLFCFFLYKRNGFDTPIIQKSRWVRPVFQRTCDIHVEYVSVF